MFNQNSYYFLLDHEIDSPIEQLFYIAFTTVQKLNFIDDLDPIPTTKGVFQSGMNLQPQVEMGKYRVDFLIQYSKSHIVKTGEEQNTNMVREVIVECDSQQWHERSEKERRYEKARDRFLTTRGYKTFHFTGKEIVDEPFRVAAEVIAFLTEDTIENLLDSISNYE